MQKRPNPWRKAAIKEVNDGESRTNPGDSTHRKMDN